MSHRSESVFSKSTKVNRSPVQTVKKKITSRQSNCQLCSEPDNGEMVQCDQCDLWFHFKCVNVTKEIENLDWLCEHCINNQKITDRKDSIQVSLTSSKRKLLELQRIEEERVLRQQREEDLTKKLNESDQQYLNKKYAIIGADISDDENEGENEDVNDQGQQKRTDEWVEYQLTKIQGQRSENVSVNHLKIDEQNMLHPPTCMMNSLNLNNVNKTNTDRLPTSPPSANEQINLSTSISQHLFTNIPVSTNSIYVQSNIDNINFCQIPAIQTPLVSTTTTTNKDDMLPVCRPSINNLSTALNIENNSVPTTTTIDNTHTASIPTSTMHHFNTIRQPNCNFHQPRTTFNNNFTSTSERNIPASTSQFYITAPVSDNNNICMNSPENLSPMPRNFSNNHFVAHQVFPKELPLFHGNPIEWPIFYSSFTSSTRSCGYSNDENLVRLQKCLKGRALETVRSKLLLPDTVPEVIETLKMLFGRPELIIHSLLSKIRSEPPPKPDKLETLINYALAVQNLCATIVASGMASHLCNPSLMYELVEKLPTQIKLNWAVHKQKIITPDLSTLGDWLFQMARAASEVTLPSFTNSMAECKNSESKNKNKSYLHTHSEQSTNQSSTGRICNICNKPFHPVHQCQKFINFDHKERWNVVRSLKLCRKCLGRHSHFHCKVNKVCEKDNCNSKHHPSLHNDNPPLMIPQNELNKRENGDNPIHNCNAHRQSNTTTLFRVVPIILHGRSKSLKTFAFLDEGSSLTLLEEQLANELDLGGIEENLSLKWTGDTVRVENNSRRLSIKVSGINDRSETHILHNVRTVKHLSLPHQSISTQILKKEYPHLADLPLQNFNNAQPRILIGIDNWKLGIPLEVREGQDQQPVATRTRLGWVLHGIVKTTKPSTNIVNNHHFHICSGNTDKQLHQIVKEFFKLDNIGIKIPATAADSKENKRAELILKHTTKRSLNQFETGLLWKYDSFKLPNSYSMARKRLLCLEKQMQKDQQLAANLHQQIQGYLQKGYIKQLSSDEVKTVGPTWYLPIFTVTNHNKPGKVRIVWDAAAEVDGVSLNTMLLKGPDLLVSLPAIIQRFRENKIALCGDIREMFHQIKISRKDQNCQRFLWRNDPSQSPKIFTMQVMTFGASCSPCSAHYVKNLNAADYKQQYPRAFRAITENHYVDDLMDGADNVNEAITLAKQVKFIHNQGGFEIHNWLSNSVEVLDALNETNNTKHKYFDNSSNDSVAEKVLGMWWNINNDTFTYSLRYTNLSGDLLYGNRRPTKREVLRTLMSIFDPLGLIAFFLVYIKILLQDIWRSSIDWDDSITDSQFERWLNWVRILPNVEDVKIPRYYYNARDKKETIQLHIFVDASEEACATVAFFRFTTPMGIKCVLVGAKTKVAPQRPVSIPRLELQAAIMGTRLAESIYQNHVIKPSKRFFWTDSRTVLCWLNADARKYRQYVAFRVGEILESTNVSEWQWVPTKENVADDATKWARSPKFDQNNRWFIGPQFLYDSEIHWPTDPNRKHYTTEEEEKPHHIHTVTPASIIEINRFSKWPKLVNSIAYVLRFLNNTRAKRYPHFICQNSSLTLEERKCAEIILYRQAQQEVYSNELKLLKQCKPIPKSSPLFKKSPYLDNKNVLRMYGRLDSADWIPSDTKRPIILPKSHQITSLIVADYHSKYKHQYHETVINELHQLYCIPSIRVVLKKVRRACQSCKNQHAKPEPPQMGDLPLARISPFHQPFSYVGVDFFGPLHVVVGRHTEKRWVALFTCLTIRAIHLEIAHSLSTDSFIMCLRNFMSRRGTPLEIRCDNGTNFVGARNELQKELENINLNKVKEQITSVMWVFNPPSSPHMGGSWERLVRSIKSTVPKILATTKMTDELLRAVLMEAENIINSRPLTTVPIDSEEHEALTPKHFLLGSSSGNKIVGEFDDHPASLKKQWKISQKITNQFWRRWVREYLPVITRRTKWFGAVKPIEKGDVVIVVDERSPRNCWHKGRVIETTTGRSGQVRKAVIQTKDGIYTRPAVKLAVLDVKRKK